MRHPDLSCKPAEIDPGDSFVESLKVRWCAAEIDAFTESRLQTIWPKHGVKSMA
jgi:hypothetical protein